MARPAAATGCLLDSQSIVPAPPLRSLWLVQPVLTFLRLPAPQMVTRGRAFLERLHLLSEGHVFRRGFFVFPFVPLGQIEGFGDSGSLRHSNLETKTTTVIMAAQRRMFRQRCCHPPIYHIGPFLPLRREQSKLKGVSGTSRLSAGSTLALTGEGGCFLSTAAKSSSLYSFPGWLSPWCLILFSVQKWKSTGFVT